MTDLVSITLVNPQMGENIGAAARAMANFSLSNLRLINPRDGWPNEAAIANASGAFDVIPDAALFSSVEDVIADGLCDDSAAWKEEHELYNVDNDYGWFEMTSVAS